MIKEGHMHTNLGEERQECRALSSTAAYWFCREHSKRHSAHKATRSWTQAQNMGTSCIRLITNMSLLCIQDTSRRFLSAEENIKPKATVSRHRRDSALTEGVAQPRSGLVKHQERLNVLSAVGAAWPSSHTSKSMQVQPKHAKMHLYLHETHV